jgi:hypothetical protein
MSYNELLQIAESRHIAKINHKHKIEKFLTRLMEGGVIPEPDSIAGELGGQIYVNWKAPIEMRILFHERGGKITFGVLCLQYSATMPEHLKNLQRSPIMSVDYDDVDTVKNMMQEVLAYML